MNQNLPVQRANSFIPGSQARAANKTFSIGEMGLREILSTLFKHKSMILLFFVLITGLVCASIIFYLKFLYEPVYEAKSLILVNPGWESQNIDLSLDQRQPAVNSHDSMAIVLATELRILQSRDLKEKIINTMKPEVIFPRLGQDIPMGFTATERALYLFEKNFSAKANIPFQGSVGNIIEVSFTGSDPSMAAKVVNELVDSYIVKRGDTYRNPKALLFLDRKSEEYKQQLAEAESKLKAFQDQSQIISFDEQRTLLVNKQRQLVDASRDNENQIAQIQEKTSELEKQLPSIQKTSIAASEKMSEMDNRLFALQLQEKELLSKYKEDNRFITTVREQIKLTQDYISSHGLGSKLAPVDPAYQDLQKQILQNKAEQGALKIKQKGLDEQLKEVTAEINTFESQESNYKRLARDVADKEDKHKAYLAKLEEARIHDELDRQKMASVSVLEPASIPIIPDNLPRTLIFYVAVALFLGIAGSIGFAFILEIMSPGMSTPAAAEKRLELPVLAVVAYK